MGKPQRGRISMNKMIKVLYDKKNRAVPFAEEDIALAKQIAVNGS